MSSSRPTDPRATHHGEESPLERATRVAEEGRTLALDQGAELAAVAGRVEALEQLVGRAPSALPGDRGSGLAQHLVDLTTAVAALRESLEADRRERAGEALAHAERREPWSRAGWLAAGAGIAAVVGASAAGALHWIATLHH